MIIQWQNEYETFIYSVELGLLLALNNISFISFIEKCSKCPLVVPHLWLEAGISSMMFV